MHYMRQIGARRKPRPGRLKGDALKQLRYACFERDNNTCQVCGIEVWPWVHHSRPRSAHMDHIKAKRMGGDNLSNVRTLCGSCHRAKHSGTNRDGKFQH